MATFAERLKILREQKGLTQEKLAEAVGVSRSTIGGYEAPSKEREPDFEIVRLLADFFGVTVDYLVGRVDDPASHDPSTPPWWHRDTPPTDVELEEFLKTANIHFDGAPLTDEDKEDIVAYLRFRWEREKKKREKESKK